MFHQHTQQPANPVHSHAAATDSVADRSFAGPATDSTRLPIHPDEMVSFHLTGADEFTLVSTVYQQVSEFVMRRAQQSIPVDARDDLRQAIAEGVRAGRPLRHLFRLQDFKVMDLRIQIGRDQQVTIVGIVIPLINISGVEMTRVQQMENLTSREREVFELLVEGCTSKVIAKRLSLSPRTIERHRGQVHKKTSTHSVAELVRLWIAAGKDFSRKLAPQDRQIPPMNDSWMRRAA